MSESIVFYPRKLPIWATDQVTSATWANQAQFTISAASGSAGLAIPFIGDGTAFKTLKVMIRSGSQAGTLHAQIQGANAAPDVVNVSGLPDGTAITNGVAGTAAITGGINQIVTLTWATAPTPTGLHWLVLEGSSGGVIDIEIAYSADWVSRNSFAGRPYKTVYHDGVDWNNEATSGRAGVTAFDGSGNSIKSIMDTCVPVISSTTDVATAITADNKEVLGVKFTAKAGYVNLKGLNFWSGTLGTDMNYQMKLATAAGTVVATSSKLNEQMTSSAGRQLSMAFDTPAVLTPGTTYRLFLMNPEDTADDIGILYFDLNAASDMAIYFGLDSGEFTFTQATDPPEYGAAGVGTWTDDDTKMPVFSLMFEEDLSSIGGSCDYPAEADVQSGVAYDNGNLTGTFQSPLESQVLNGVGFGAAGTEFTGDVVQPAVSNVRSGINFGSLSSLSGTLQLPIEAQVLNGVGFGAAGTEFTGNVILPIIGNVRSGVAFGSLSSLNGTLQLPAVGNVLNSIGYGTGGTEFTGTYQVTAAGDVRSGINFGAGGALTGTLILPNITEVLDGIGFGTAGTEFTGNVVLPGIGDVRLAVTFGPNSTLVGTLSGGGGTSAHTSIIPG